MMMRQSEEERGFCFDNAYEPIFKLPLYFLSRERLNFLNISRYGNEGCSYLYEMEAYIDGSKGASEGAVSYAIDATYYGNVSRFINHRYSAVYPSRTLGIF